MSLWFEGVFKLDSSFDKDEIMEVYIYETNQSIERLEQIIIDSEKEEDYTSYIDEIFRIMHTIKGSSAMMEFKNISDLAHSLEDLFYYIREEKTNDFNQTIVTDLILKSIDFIKDQINQIDLSSKSEGNPYDLINQVRRYLNKLKDEKKSIKAKKSNHKKKDKNKYKYEIKVFFQEDAEMENIRAFTIVHQIQSLGEIVSYYPPDIVENNDTANKIKKEGFTLIIETNKGKEKLKSFLGQISLAKKIDYKRIKPTKQYEKNKGRDKTKPDNTNNSENNNILEMKKNKSSSMKMISVGVNKLDNLMDLVGELVISESMVTQNPDLEGLELTSFKKASRRLRKIIKDLQDEVMSARMIPLTITFQKMNRIIRDISKKTNKKVELILDGANTEVDKNIVEVIADPLMHIVRNAVDHGIETADKRLDKNKNPVGTIILKAQNIGGSVNIIVKDDGQGLQKDRILDKAIKNNLLKKDIDEYTDQEIFSLALLPGFSTKEEVTEFSGRGVGLDVVGKTIEAIRGSITIDSVPDKGTTINIKIPLTLAIINGMIVRVGKSKYIIPTSNIVQSIHVKSDKVIKDPEGNEMIVIRGQAYPILRLNEFYNANSTIERIEDGIVILVESDNNSICLFVDELMGQQQIVIKDVPKYIKNIEGITGCTLLGDGSISLILDMVYLTNL